MTRTEIAELLFSADDALNWDDLHEHCPEDLALKFGLTEADANLAYLAIQGQTDGRRSECYATDKYKEPGCSWSFNDCLAEAVHEGFDGWEPDERLVIAAFLADMGLAVNKANQ